MIIKEFVSVLLDLFIMIRLKYLVLLFVLIDGGVLQNLSALENDKLCLEDDFIDNQDFFKLGCYGKRNLIPLFLFI